MGKKEKRAMFSLKTDVNFCRHARSLFDEENDYKLDKGISEWDKLYMGVSSAADDMECDTEYVDAVRKQKKKRKIYSVATTLFEDDEEDVAEQIECRISEADQVIQAKATLVTEAMDSQMEDVNTLRPIIQAKAYAVKDYQQPEENEQEIKDRALRIAKDFAKSENIICVGDASYAYNGQFYTLLNENEVQRKIFHTYQNEIAKGSASSVLRNAANLLPFCIAKEYEEFPVNADIIVFENGTLEVNTGVFRKNSPLDLASSALGIRYDSTCKKMPWTKHFLQTIADGDKDLYELMLQVIGYILSNDIKAKSFFYLEGVGDAGKSRFCDLIASFFPVSGKNKVARIALQNLGGKFALGNLVNAKLNISEDLPDSPLSPVTVSRIKMISDANRLEAEAKYVQPFSFRPTCKMLFASNHPLRLKEYDAAFVNRVVYIPFLKPIPKEKQDKYILEKMQNELPALFNHAFAAYKRLVAGGYIWAGSGRFKPNFSIASSGISVDKESVLKRFVSSCCEFQEDSIVPVSELQAAYNEFCREHTYEAIKGDRFSREIFSVLPEEVVRTKIGNQQRGFKGVRLKKDCYAKEESLFPMNGELSW